MKTIAIDFDDTYTADPALWDCFIADAISRGHKVVCVTWRQDTPDNRADTKRIGVPVYFANRESKRWYVETFWQLHVDIWIDDNPISVERGL